MAAGGWPAANDQIDPQSLLRTVMDEGNPECRVRRVLGTEFADGVMQGLGRIGGGRAVRTVETAVEGGGHLGRGLVADGPQGRHDVPESRDAQCGGGAEATARASLGTLRLPRLARHDGTGRLRFVPAGR